MVRLQQPQTWPIVGSGTPGMSQGQCGGSLRLKEMAIMRRIPERTKKGRFHLKLEGLTQDMFPITY